MDILFEFFYSHLEMLMIELKLMFLVWAKHLNKDFIHHVSIIYIINHTTMSTTDFNYSDCLFEARLYKPAMLRFRKK